MSIDRTNWTALVDDDASNTTGTLWTRDKVKTVLLDPIDAAIGASKICQGRATLISGSPVADGTGITSIYWTPFGGNELGLYNGSYWPSLAFPETALAIGTVTSGLPYDVFGYNNAGVFAMEKLAWASASARATAIVLQDGIRVKSGDATRRLLYSFTPVSTTTTTDDVLLRYLYNYYNPRPKPVRRRETNSVWTYNTGTIRQARASALNQVGIFAGFAERMIDLGVLVTVTNDTNATIAVTGIGEDSTTTISVDAAGGLGIVPAANIYSMITSRLCKMPAIGVRNYTWLEKGNGAAGSTLWFGVSVQGEAPTGLEGVWEC